MSCQDRSLGYTELRVSDLARPATSEDGKFLYESTGERDVEEPLKTGNGAFKGRLHYIASFVPAYAVRGIHFNSGPSELEQAADRTAASPDGSEGGTVDDGNESEEEDNVVPEGVTVKHPVDENQVEGAEAQKTHRPTKSTDTTATTFTTGTTTEDEKQEEQGIEMSKEELLSHRTSSMVLVRAGTHRVVQRPVSSFSTSCPAVCTRRRDSRFSSTMHTGRRSVLRARAVPRRNGSTLAKVWSRSSISAASGYV